MLVTKRSGDKQPLELDKIESVVRFAAEGLDVDVAGVIKNAKLQFTDGVSTKTIHKLLVKSAVDMISRYSPDYQYLSARLSLYNVRKEAYGKYEAPTFEQHVINMVAKGKYDQDLLDFSAHDFDLLEQAINHTRDNNFTYAAVGQMTDKYLLRPRGDNSDTCAFYESPQMMYMGIACTLIQESDCYDHEDYINKIIKFYDAASTFKFSLPTPIMAGARTPTRQFSSCVLIKAGDSLDSINATSSAITTYVAKKAGIGIDAGMIRPVGSSVRNGELHHTGLIPFLKYFNSALKSCSQGGVRGGSADVFYPMWHKEFFNLIVLKNNRGVEENRIRTMDYGVQINGEMIRRLIYGENIYLFSPHEFPEMYEAYFADQEEFKRLYENACTLADAGLCYSEKHSAADVWNALLNERSDTGRIYIAFVDNINNQSPFSETIYQSNLCVAPETMILTDRGYIPIAELEGDNVNVWNGEEWSAVDVVKTGENQKLVKVTTNCGYELECTPYHKFYVFDGYGKPYKEKRAHELIQGDKLAKFDLPIVEGDKDLEKAYINGFFSGDGCYFKGKNIVYLYDEKLKLHDIFANSEHTYYIDQRDIQNREVFHMVGLKDKFFVPSSDYTVQARLDWLAGYLDADGCIYRNGTNEAITAASVELSFLKEIQMMLQTLGVSCKITDAMEEGYRKMPANDGTGEVKDFWCNRSWRLLISSYDSYKLLSLGLKFNRLKIEKRRPQRDAKQFVKIVDVIDEGRVDDTYCFTEPKRHMGMFNGILTGQCMEIALPTKPLVADNSDEGRIALCTLASFNLGAFDKPEDMEEWAEILQLALDGLLSYQDYPLREAYLSTQEYRTLGIGIVNLAHLFAREGVKYGSQKALELVNRWMEHLSYYLTKASVRHAERAGGCTKWKDLCYAKGMFPHEFANKRARSLVSDHKECDWDSLREAMTTTGIRNATLLAIAPTESSAQVLNACNGVEMPREYVSIKSSKSGNFKQVVPDSTLDYQLLWSNQRCTEYLKTMAVIQTWVDQSISTNTFYNPSKYLSGKVDRKDVIEDIILFYSLGGKTLYYQNIPDGAGDEEKCETCVV